MKRREEQRMRVGPRILVLRVCVCVFRMVIPPHPWPNNWHIHVAKSSSPDTARLFSRGHRCIGYAYGCCHRDRGVLASQTGPRYYSSPTAKTKAKADFAEEEHINRFAYARVGILIPRSRKQRGYQEARSHGCLCRR